MCGLGVSIVPFYFDTPPLPPIKIKQWLPKRIHSNWQILKNIQPDHYSIIFKNLQLDCILHYVNKWFSNSLSFSSNPLSGRGNDDLPWLYTQPIVIELEIKDTIDTDRSTAYLDLHLVIDSEGRLRTKTLPQKISFQFFHCEISIYMQQNCSSTCIWSYICIQVSVDIPQRVVPIGISLIEVCC